MWQNGTLRTSLYENAEEEVKPFGWRLVSQKHWTTSQCKSGIGWSEITSPWRSVIWYNAVDFSTSGFYTFCAAIHLTNELFNRLYVRDTDRSAGMDDSKVGKVLKIGTMTSKVVEFKTIRNQSIGEFSTNLLSVSCTCWKGVNVRWNQIMVMMIQLWLWSPILLL